jgi:xanthine dehydrogenase accessory factor
MDIYEEIVRLKSEGRSCALATIVQCGGSSPQKEGAKMLVRDDGSIVGTLGGGCLEAEVVQAAKMAMHDQTPLSMPFELTEKHGGLVCGGKVTVFIEPLIPEPNLIILGAGHVGKALAAAGKFAGFRITVVDNREEFAHREHIPHADEITVSEFDTVFSRVLAGEGTYIVIATRGHNFDLVALKSALRTPARYIGLLGSKRKKAVLFNTLSREGFSKEEIGRVHIPVGLPIGSVTPEEIAISIMAQIIQYRRYHGKSGFRDSSCCGLLEENAATQATAPDRE